MSEMITKSHALVAQFGTRLTVCWTALRTLWQTAVRLWAVNAS